MSKIAQFRKDMSLTQFEFSDVTKISRHRLQLAEAGIKILSDSEVRRIAKIFGFNSVPIWLSDVIDTEVIED